MIDLSENTRQLTETIRSSIPNRIGEARECETPGLTLSDIARLSQAGIRQMTREELISLIRVADIPSFREKLIGHLPYCDRETLEQLAFLAQHTIRNLGH